MFFENQENCYFLTVFRASESIFLFLKFNKSCVKLGVQFYTKFTFSKWFRTRISKIVETPISVIFSVLQKKYQNNINNFLSSSLPQVCGTSRAENAFQKHAASARAALVSSRSTTPQLSQSQVGNGNGTGPGGATGTNGTAVGGPK